MRIHLACRQPLTCLVILCTAALLPSVCHAETRFHALVIGNGDYPIGQLRNPVNDARLIGQSLSDLGFEVTLELDLTHRGMDEAITKFARGIPNGGLAFFFFAGHGIQVNGENYLIPIDASINDESAVKYKAVQQSLVLDVISGSKSNLNVFVLDCCRDNPFQRRWARSISRPRGLAPVSHIPEGTLIAYATAAGKVALDGEGENSPYTRELAKALAQRPADGLKLRDVFFLASREVKKATGQTPWMNMEASLDEFYLHKPQSGRISDAPAPSLSQSNSIALNTSLKPSLSKPLSQGTDRPLDDSLLQQARSFLSGADYELAIDAYSAIINDPDQTKEQRTQARRGRGLCYLTRGKVNDLKRAIIDYKAIGEKGILLPVRVTKAEMKVGTEARGVIHEDQIALVTQSRDDWFWINSVHGDESLQGWVNESTFVKPEPKASSSPSNAVTQSNSSAARPATSTSQPYSGQVITGYDSNGRPIVSSQGSTSQRYSSQPQQYNNGDYYSPSGQPTSRSQSYNQQQSRYPSSSQSNSRFFRFGNQNSGRSTFQPGGNGFTQPYMNRDTRPQSIFQTPRIQTPSQMIRGRAQGLFR